MRRFFRFALVQRFFITIREEGLKSALRKANTYVRMQLRRSAPSALKPEPEQPSNEGEHMYLSATWQKLAQENAFHVLNAPAVHQKQRKIALIGDLNLPQCRKYRIEQLAELWAAHGIDVRYSHYQDIPRCVGALQDATHLMEYRLQTTPLTAMYRYEARRLRLPILYDLDDPLFSVSAYETYANMKVLDPALKRHFLAEAPKYLEMMNGADILTVSTPNMIEHTKLYTQRPVYMRRNFADSSTLRDGARAMSAAQSAKNDDGAFRVAFASGSQGHEADFAILKDDMVEFLGADPNRRLMILGHFDKSMLPVDLMEQIETHPFTTYDTYLETLANADCAVMPLVDDAFNRCKSAVRVIDASSVGVPSIVGQVCDMEAMVRDGETGHVVNQDTGWCAAMTSLAADTTNAAAMGQAARHDLETRWADPTGDHIISPEVVAWVKG